MLKFLDLDKFVKNLKPVTSTIIHTKTEEFHQDGLFSEKIFGVLNSLDRKKTFSYINLNCQVIHPTAYKILMRLDRRLEKVFSTEQSFILSKGNLVEDENGETGISFFMKVFSSIKFRGESEDRDKFIKVLKEAYKSDKLFIKYIPIIPPDQRPIFKGDDGRWTHDKINDEYLSILRKTLSIKTFGSSGTMFDLMNWGVQKSVLNLDEYVKTKVGKKFGLIRSQLLGKRTDFSGRAVITGGAQLRPDQMGIPFRMAVSLFEPFIMHVLLHSGKIDKKEL